MEKSNLVHMKENMEFLGFFPSLGPMAPWELLSHCFHGAFFFLGICNCNALKELPSLIHTTHVSS